MKLPRALRYNAATTLLLTNTVDDERFAMQFLLANGCSVQCEASVRRTESCWNRWSARSVNGGASRDDAPPRYAHVGAQLESQH
ncbi:hypothetical protein K0M31_017327 [Melipona bicolor]|uniref:Uncharacterized protein n=1 Tax=Melipona bicolor TaxID=60889 RepID=A0AA40KSB7_9HYME|nr:hypothetical protein K0M31_017327 [Melipona bicolor]